MDVDIVRGGASALKYTFGSTFSIWAIQLANLKITLQLFLVGWFGVVLPW